MTQPAPREKPKGVGDIPVWQLVIVGVFLGVGGLLAGGKVAQLFFSVWMPGVVR